MSVYIFQSVSMILCMYAYMCIRMQVSLYILHLFQYALYTYLNQIDLTRMGVLFDDGGAIYVQRTKSYGK